MRIFCKTSHLMFDLGSLESYGLMEEQSIRTAALSSDLNSGLSGFWFYNKLHQISRYKSGSI